MKRVRNYILTQNKETVGLNEISAELSLTKKQVASELLQFLEDTLKENPEGLTITDLKEKTKLNRNWIAKQLEILELLGRVEMKSIGPAKLYKWSEEGLNKWEKYYRALIENSNDVVIVLQYQVPQKIGIQFISDSIERIIGIPAGEFDEEKTLKHVHPEDRGIVDSLLRIFNNESKQETLNFRFLDAAGKYRYIEAVITDLRTTPEIGGLVLNCQDVTETTILQQEIQYRIAFEQVLLNIATTLITAPETELVHLFKQNFAMIGKLMNPDDHLRNLNLTANHLFFSILDPSSENLHSIAYWDNQERDLPVLKDFYSLSLKENAWIKQSITQNEPVFVSPISSIWSKFNPTLQEELENFKEGAFLAVPFRNVNNGLSGTLMIIFQNTIKPSMIDRFLDLFQKLTAIMKSHLEKIILLYSPGSDSSKSSNLTHPSISSIIELLQNQ